MAMSATAEQSTPAGSDALSERDAAILEFERGWWRHGGAKESAVQELFGLSATRYYQVLNALIDTPQALEADRSWLRSANQKAEPKQSLDLRREPKAGR